MIAVSSLSFEKSGCINCGCDFCYGGNVQGVGTVDVTCGECNTQFVVLANGLTKSRIGYGTGKKDENGNDIFDYPVLQEHPRKEIDKHKFVRPDVRPENEIGDFCSPRGVGYDLACFVKSKEAGQRITDMINKINEEYENKAFSCWLDYREREPLWIQVKISYPNELRATILAQLISENNNVITEEQVRSAMDMKIDFANYWKYEARHKVYNAVEMSFMHDIVAKPEDITKEQRDEAYSNTWQNNNHLDQFETWGAYKQIELELARGNIENAVALARHLIDLNGDHFNYELVLQRGKDMDYITCLRGYFHDELVKSVNIYYKDTDQLEMVTDGKTSCDYWAIKENVQTSDEMKVQFLADWQNVVSMIFRIVDIDALKLATDWKTRKTVETEEKEKQALSKYPSLYSMFSLFGLYAYVSKQLEEHQFENAVLAIKHVASQMQSPLFEQLQTQTKNNDIHSLETKAVYCQISNMANKYYNEKQETVNSGGQVKKLNRKN